MTAAIKSARFAALTSLASPFAANAEAAALPPFTGIATAVPVPDSASTLLLIGIGLISLAIFAIRLKKA